VKEIGNIRHQKFVPCSPLLGDFVGGTSLEERFFAKVGSRADPVGALQTVSRVPVVKLSSAVCFSVSSTFTLEEIIIL
jgi:hypothetical protein